MNILKFITIFILFPKYSFAYIDPGTASLVLQILGSMIVGCLVFFRTIKLQISNFFSRLFKKKKNKRKPLT